jgi:hypothetical protein
VASLRAQSLTAGSALRSVPAKFERSTAMTLDPSTLKPSRVTRAIVKRTRGRTSGPATRLISPSDLGRILKPFVFLDLFRP